MNDNLAPPPQFDPRIVPQPPRLHWGWVLALQIVTLGVFQLVWLVVQAVWVKRMTGNSRGLTWAIVNLSAFPALILLAITIGIIMGVTGHTAEAQRVSGAVEGLYRIVFFLLNIGTAFTLRGQMEYYPIQLPLSGAMTFFFGTIYFQYHLHDYVVPEAADVFGNIPQAPLYVPPTSQEPSA